MPVSYRIDKSQGVVFTKGEGVVTSQEILNFQHALLQDPDFDPGFNQLLEATEITLVDATADEIKRIAQSGLFMESSRRAIVAPNQPATLVFRIEHFWRDAEPDNNKIFRDIDEARKWLGLN